MPSFSDLRSMYRLQKEAKRVKKELKNIHVEAEGRFCIVVVTPEPEIVSIVIKDGAPSAELGLDLSDALNRALKKAQVVSAEKMKPLMGEMGVPGGE